MRFIRFGLLGLTLCGVLWVSAIKSGKDMNHGGVLSRQLSSKGSLNVLSLGGSTTWGSGLARRDLAFPGLIAKDSLVSRSDNLAIRASSAMWPATCLQSLMDQNQLLNNEYHVILLEFSINGVQGLQLLLQRLRLRFPTSLIIYIDLYSNRTPGFSNCLGDNCKMTVPKQQALVNMIKEVGGYAISLPRPKDPLHYHDILHWFQSDHHHLNEEGHQLVAEYVIRLIHSHTPSIELSSTTKGDWLDGDSCLNWFENGVIPPQSVQIQGGQMNRFAKNKYALEIKDEKTVVLSMLPGFKPEKEAPLMLVFMTKGNPSLYPYLQARVEERDPVVVNPLSKKWADDHVTSTQVVGVVGTNDYRLHLTNMEPQKEYPFRLVGTVMCSACVQLGFDVRKRCQQRGCVHSVED